MFEKSALARVLLLLVVAAGVSFSAQAEQPLHKGQAPGYFRTKVGALEVTSLYDGAGAFQVDWLKGKPAAVEEIGSAAKDNPHFLDGNEAGFLINTGTKLVLVDVGAGPWFGGSAFGHLGESLRQAGYKPEQIDMVLVTHLHSDHVGGLTSKSGERQFPNAQIYVAQAESDFWLSKETAARAPSDAKPFFDAAQAIAAPYIKAGKWHTFQPNEKILDAMTIVPLPAHTPGHSGYQSNPKETRSSSGATPSIPSMLSFPTPTWRQYLTLTWKEPLHSGRSCSRPLLGRTS
ncbi:MBL fold metallo-hydrolase [Bradyrhizobium tropiciagri]|uniref:MBL fold metallo-hydrolase n=1 Tax=Bradyrhizobium tropiciagri TaxID=312253 RepID=UPI00067D0A17|nr:MBL fold metallo-hydrolase [Bradyrhizobium tropiciagri]